MNSLIQSEWQRMWKRPKTLISLILFTAIVLFDCLFLGVQRFGAFDNIHTAPLTAQNFSVFLLKEVSFLLTLIVAPLLIVDSINGEYTAGQLRLVLIRPISFARLFAAKWLNLAFMLLLFTAVTFMIGELAGHLLKPAADSVRYLNPAQVYDHSDAFIYALQSYGLFYLIVLAELSVVGLVSSLMPNALVSFFVSLGVLIGALYISDTLGFFLMSASVIFQLMAGSYAAPFYGPVLVCTGIGFLATMEVWQRRSWTR
ncbi:ABC transporter permease [Paenibacillus albidus]|uniref:ABC transporter permease n=1 Tax=Paenibacillus albidus TaxID=2041023 RepID=UPI001BE7E827|nr:ABC transporter permease [Paenibacillus albidus]MBT2291098.1 ABC transporter permease [Paenibacillus albidus]